MLDHLEGNLSPQDTLALRAFAILHPELDLNFDEELVSLENEKIAFNGKQHLKVNFDDALVIGYMENVLEGKEKQTAETLALTHPLFIKELALYKKTIATPDTSIVFENKAALKREPKVIVFTQTVSFRIAAAIILMVGIWLVISKVFVSDQTTAPQQAAKTKTALPSTNNPEKKDIQETEIHSEKVLANATKKNNATIFNATIQKNNDPIINPVIKEEQPMEVAVNNDTLSKQKHIQYLDTNALKLANTSHKEKQSRFIIEEGIDDELAATNPAVKKNKLFNLASKVFKKLNQNGLGKVNGSENDNELFIGAVSISKN